MELQNLLDRVRLGYAVFCAVVLVAFREMFGLTRLSSLALACSGIAYSALRLHMPVRARMTRLPPLADWFDWVFIALFVFCTGGISSCFHSACLLPISGATLRYGPPSGLVGLFISACLAVTSYVAPSQGHPLPSWLHVCCSIVGMLFLIVVAGATFQKEKALRARLYRASVTDPLTGLYNSAYLRARASEEALRFQRDGRSFSIAFLDIDRFKSVNDSYGHLCGDEALRRVATVITHSVRQADVPSRYGGDEFVILFPGCGCEAAISALARLQASFALPIVVNEIEIRLSVSGGVASFPEDGEDLDSMLSSADRRMYACKSKTRQSGL